ncbi:MAG: hypothetical protein WAU07_00070 [Microgenomates group bacterium]
MARRPSEVTTNLRPEDYENLKAAETLAETLRKLIEGLDEKKRNQQSQGNKEEK